MMVDKRPHVWGNECKLRTEFNMSKDRAVTQCIDAFT